MVEDGDEAFHFFFVIRVEVGTIAIAGIEEIGAPEVVGEVVHGDVA